MLKNLSPRFIEELGSPNPQPFAILEIQSKGQSDEATTEAHWTANIPGGTSNVDYTSPPPNTGDVILAATAAENTTTTKNPPTSNIENTWGAGDYTDIDEWPVANDGNFLRTFRASIGTSSPDFIGAIAATDLNNLIAEIPDNAQIKAVNILCRGRWDSNPPSGATTLEGRIRIDGVNHDQGTPIAMTNSFADHYFPFTINPDTSTPWDKDALSTLEGVGVAGNLTSTDTILHRLECSQVYLEVIWFDFETDGSITVQLDLGVDANTENNAVISIDDNVPTGSGLTYTLEGSATGAWGGEEVALGSVEDGSPVSGYRFYRPTSTLTGDGTVTSVVKSIKVEIPDRIYRFTSRTGGIFGALPYLVGIPGRTISIDLKDFVTLGSSLNANLTKDDSVVQMIRENYFKNLNASVRIGLYRDDITEDDLAFTFQGKVDGYNVGLEDVSISLKDGTKDLSAKWPAGISTTKDGTHMVDVINSVIDDVGIAARYVNRGSLDTLKSSVGDGSPASPNYVVYRGGSPPIAVGDTTITEPDAAKKVVGELLELLGAYMVSQEDGKITVVEYDSSKAAVGDTWTTDDFVEDPAYNPDVENIVNDTFVYIDWNGEGTDAKDFSNLHKSPDATSISNWGETNTRIIKSKWLAGSAAGGYYGEELALHIGARETERRKNGMGILPVKTSLSEFELQVGDMKDIDASDLIINPDVGTGDVRKFIVVNKDVDWENVVISWSLVEAR